MRILFTTHGGSGHWRPLAPLATASVRTQHEIAFATTPAFCSIIEQHGFSSFPVGVDDESTTHTSPSSKPNDRSAEPDQALLVWANEFAGSRASRCLPDLLELCRLWQPDLIVREISEFSGCIAAERLSLPHAAIQISAFRPALHDVIAEPLARLRAMVGLSPDSTLTMLYRYLFLATAPPSLQPKVQQLPATMRFIRYEPFDRIAGNSSPDWLKHLPPRPLIAVSLGTAYNRVPGVLSAIQSALRDEAVNLIVTTGLDERSDVVRTAPNQWVVPYLPLSLLLPQCDAIISHGGFNTVMTALGCGLPMVILPIAADQPDNAARCAELGAGIALYGTARTPSAIRAATRAALYEPEYGNRARWLAQEMRALPGPEHAVTLLEQLVHEAHP